MKKIWMFFFFFVLGIVFFPSNFSYAQEKNVEVTYSTNINSSDNVSQPNYYEKKPISLSGMSNENNSNKEALPNTGTIEEPYIILMGMFIILLICLGLLFLDVYRKGGNKDA